MFLLLALCSGCVEVACALSASPAAFGTLVDMASLKAFSHLAGSNHLSLWFHLWFQLFGPHESTGTVRGGLLGCWGALGGEGASKFTMEIYDISVFLLAFCSTASCGIHGNRTSESHFRISPTWPYPHHVFLGFYRGRNRELDDGLSSERSVTAGVTN